MTQEKTLQTEKSFAEKFRSLPILEKEKVTNFFNLHNAATWMFLQMSQEAKDYTNEAISASSVAMKSSVDEAVEDLNNE